MIAKHTRQLRIVAEPDALQAEMDALKHLQAETAADLDALLPRAMLAKMQRSYDVVFSFAGEDRKYVNRVAKFLRSQEVAVFYDSFEEANLWGKDLAEHFDSVYRQSGQYCVIFISKFYLTKCGPHTSAGRLWRGR